MIMFFGYKWLNNYGEADNGIWLAGLRDLKPEQILRGIQACRDGGKEWPPTLPEFRKMCLPPIVPPYHTRYLSLLAPSCCEKIGSENIRKMKNVLKTKKFMLNKNGMIG